MPEQDPPESPELRARDLVRRREIEPRERRSVVGDRLNDRARRGPGSERRARLFDRLGVANPYDQDAKDKGLALGDVAIAQEKRQPAPHALPKDPAAKSAPAGPRLPNVPRAEPSAPPAKPAANRPAAARPAGAGEDPARPVHRRPDLPARGQVVEPRKPGSPPLKPLPMRPGVVPPGQEPAGAKGPPPKGATAGGAAPPRPPPPRPSAGPVGNAAPRAAPPRGPDLADLGAAGPERALPQPEAARSAGSSGRVGIARPTQLSGGPVERPARPEPAPPVISAPPEEALLEVAPNPKATAAPEARAPAPPPASRKPPAGDLDDLFGFAQNEGRLRMPSRKKGKDTDEAP